MPGGPGGRLEGPPKVAWPNFGRGRRRGRRDPEGIGGDKHLIGAFHHTHQPVRRMSWRAPHVSGAPTPLGVTYAAVGSWDHKDVRRPFICLATRGSGATPTRRAHTSGGCGESEAGTRPGARPLDPRTHDANIPAGSPRHNSRFCDRDGRHSPRLASREASA
jgi:hypothetical protein